MRRGLLLLSSLLAVPACSDSSTEFWLPGNQLLPMVALNGDTATGPRLAFVDQTSSTAFLMDPADPALRPTLVQVGKRPVTAVRHTGSNRLMVLSAGENGSSSKAATPPQLLIVDPTAPTNGIPQPLPSAFDGLAQSADGKFAVMYHQPSSKLATSSALFNPNEMVVADFSANIAGAPVVTPKSIRSLGNVPSSIRFSPTYSKRGEHRLAVVLSQSYLTLFDLLNLPQSEISLPLCLTGSSCNYQVDDVVFDPSSFKLYVRATGAKDIYQVSLTESETPDANLKYALSASLSMLAVGASAADMVLYGADQDARLAVLAPSAKSLVIIDPSTSNSASVALAIPATKIVPFVTPSADAGSKPKNQALLLDDKSSSNSALFADFGSADAAAGTSVKQYSISGSVSTVIPISTYSVASPGAPNVAILIFNNRSSGNDTVVMSVVNMDTRSFFDFSSTMALTSSYLEVRQATATGRLWSLISPDDGTSSPNSGIYYRDVPSSVGSLTPTVWLDQTITSITPLADAAGIRYLVLGHLDPTGYGNLTLLDAIVPDRATARTAYGFLFTDYLGRNQP
jgi:hypothetical protein